ncbi:MAG: Gfo/Idh/MocA family oxidoreductase [Clostridia bacterium]|nr:Gfo/Idh/MocA family oxidoreductase [Clostridia bacterium]
MTHKMGIIGFGGMGSFHYKKLLKGQEIVATGVWDIKEERREYARSFGLHIYESLEDLLADESIEIVLIATPNDVHHTIAIQALEAGKHVICEKPVTLNAKLLTEMLEAADKAGKLLTVHQNRRWDRGYRIVHQILGEGILGDVYRIESRVHGAHGIPGDWRQDPKQGGGMVYDWGIHLLDQAVMLFPDAKIRSVYATLNHVTNEQTDDGFFIDLTFDNGIHYTVEVGTSHFIPLPRWMVMGQDGTMLLDNWGLEGKIVCAHGEDDKDVVPVVTAAGLTKTMAPRREDTIKTLDIPDIWPDIGEYYRNITACLEGEATPIVTHDQMRRVMRLIEAVFASARTGEVIRFEIPLES